MTSKIDRHVEKAGKDSLVHPPLSPPAISTLHEGHSDLASHFVLGEDELRDRQLDRSNSIARQSSSDGWGKKASWVMGHVGLPEATVIPTLRGHDPLKFAFPYLC